MARHWDEGEPYVVIEKHSGSVGSLLIGVAIGAGIALLFAPQSGAETRRVLQREADRARRRARDLADEMSETVAESLQQARSKVEEQLDTARSAVDVKRQQVTRAVEAGRQAARQARDDLERRIAETKAAYEAGQQVARDGGAAPAAPSPAAGDTPGGASGA